MDNELRFISALLRANRADQEQFYCQQIPKGIFKLREQEIHWVYAFREKYAQYPSVKAFESRFNKKLIKHSDPMAASLQPVLDRAMFAQMSLVQESTKKIIDEGGSMESAMRVMKEGIS